MWMSTRITSHTCANSAPNVLPVLKTWESTSKSSTLLAVLEVVQSEAELGRLKKENMFVIFVTNRSARLLPLRGISICTMGLNHLCAHCVQTPTLQVWACDVMSANGILIFNSFKTSIWQWKDYVAQVYKSVWTVLLFLCILQLSMCKILLK